MATLFDIIGGDRLRAVIEDFYERLIADAMVGFFFADKNRQRLVDKEWECPARVLGADVPYTGRAMPEAHRASPIMGGHFARRLTILRETLDDHGVDSRVREAWLSHTEKLRATITRDRGTECRHEQSAASPGPRAGRSLSILDK